MNKFNLRKVLEYFGLDADTDWLAEELFPKNKYPKVAFARVLKGENDLSVPQLEALAECLGVMPQELFGLDDWKGLIIDSQLTIIKGEYTIKLREPKSNYATLYKNGAPVTTVLIAGTPTINEFITMIDTTINKLSQNGDNQN